MSGNQSSYQVWLQQVDERRSDEIHGQDVENSMNTPTSPSPTSMMDEEEQPPGPPTDTTGTIVRQQSADQSDDMSRVSSRDFLESGDLMSGEVGEVKEQRKVMFQEGPGEAKERVTGLVRGQGRRSRPGGRVSVFDRLLGRTNATTPASIPSPSRTSAVRSTRDMGARASIFGSVLSMSIVEGHSERSFLSSNIVLPLMVSLVVLFGGCFVVPAILLDHSTEGLDFFNPLTSEVKFMVYVPALSIIPVSMFFKWGFYNLTVSFAQKIEDADKVRWRDVFTPSQTSILFFCAVTIRHTRGIANACVQDIYLETTSLLLDSALAFALFATWISVLDDAYAGVFSYACQLESIPLDSPKTRKWESIMKSFSRFGNPEVDKGYSIPGGSRSSALVLSEIFGVYVNIGKLAGFITLALFFVGVDLYTNLFIIGISVFLTGLIAALRINDAIATVLPLAMSNTLHIGEIVSLSRPGFTPADDPATHIVGFVEGITWSHTVIRDFRRKQTFVPHSELQKLVVANWSRRPAKLCHFRLQVVPGLSDGGARLAKLARFCGNWIKQHTRIDQNQYQKSVIKMSKLSAAPLLEVIFYPGVGEKARTLRAEFTLMIFDAAKRLNICLTPAEVRPKTAWDWEQPPSTTGENNAIDLLVGNDDEAAEQEEENLLDTFYDLMPSGDLTSRAGCDPIAKKKN